MLFDLKTFDLKAFGFSTSFLKFSLPVTVRLNLVSFVKNDEFCFLNLFKIILFEKNVKKATCEVELINLKVIDFYCFLVNVLSPFGYIAD